MNIRIYYIYAVRRRYSVVLQIARRCAGLLLMLIGAFARADEAADQLERAELLRQFTETRSSQPQDDPSKLPGASYEYGPGTSRRQQFEDTQWRKLLGGQQTQIYGPTIQSVPESQWRQQSFDRDRRGEDLSADILRRSRQSLSNSPR
jgi:hypothetical protein